MNNVLVVAAHPDDEILGCGGALCRHVDDGDKVHVLILATGATARKGGGTAEVENLKRACAKACGIIGTEPPVFAGLPDNCMDTVALLGNRKIGRGGSDGPCSLRRLYPLGERHEHRSSFDSRGHPYRLSATSG